MAKWDSIEYQKIQRATLEGEKLIVSFLNGDRFELPASNFLPIENTEIDDAKIEHTEYDITITTPTTRTKIPWDKIRVINDMDFAKYMAQKAEENSKLVGVRLKALREKKDIKSFELAERAGVTPQTITRIEKGHTDVSFATLRKILAAMGYSLRDLATLETVSENQTSKPSYHLLLRNLGQLGIDSSLINKIIPQALANQFSNKENIPELAKREIGTYLSRIFGWEVQDIWENKELVIENTPARLAYFKTPSKGNLSQIRAYSHYAYYLANTISKVNNKDSEFGYPGDLEEFREIFYRTYLKLTFQNLLNFTWDLGICVIPLNDSGVFHGASWNINDKHVIVLKQKTESHARWIFDLLHELYHVFVHLDNINTSVIETEELNPFANNDSPEELEANSFASQFLFGKRAEDLAALALKRAEYRLDYLKNAVTHIAEEEGVGADFLANYLAFRLQINGENWWKTASALQITNPSPFIIAADTLKARINVESLNPIDKNLVNSALNN